MTASNDLEGNKRRLKEFRAQREKEMFGILRKVLTKRAPALAIKTHDLRLLEFTTQERKTICNLLAEELSASGLDRASEPNAHGLAIEAIIEMIIRPAREPT